MKGLVLQVAALAANPARISELARPLSDVVEAVRHSLVVGEVSAPSARGRVDAA